MWKLAHARFEQQVAAVVGLLCLVLVAVSVGGAIWLNRQSAVEAAGRDLANRAASLAAALETSASERVREVSLLAELGKRRGDWAGHPDAIRATLEAARASLPDYAWLGYVGADAIVRAGTDGDLDGVAVADQAWFAAVASGVREPRAFADGASDAGRAARAVHVNAPVRDDAGRLLGIVAARLGGPWMEDVRERLAASGPEQGDVAVVAPDGTVVIGSEAAVAPVRTELLAAMHVAGRGRFTSTGGQPHQLVAYAVAGGERDRPGLGWTVVVRETVALAASPVDAFARTAVALGAAVALAGIVLAFAIARAAAFPIRRLTAAACLIGRDRTATTLPRVGGSREIIELSSALRALLRRVGTAERELSAAEIRSALTSRRFQREIDVLRRCADTDPLTGLLNRRAFMAFATDAMTYFHRYERNIAILIGDIDHFKHINDTWGHGVGDDVIRAIGTLLNGAVRSTDRVARLGGEEFIVLLREVDEAGVLAFGERIRAAVATARIEAGGHGIGATVSIGAAIVSGHDADVGALIERADRSLYEAKRAGRDRVRLSGQPTAAVDRAA